MAFDKNLLFKARVPEGEVELEGLGTVRVRGLSRNEALAVANAKGPGATERKTLAFGMVDPKLTENEILSWQENSPAGEIQKVGQKIQELSGMADDSEREAMATFRDGPDDGVRVLPSDEAGDDGGPAPGGDE